MTSVPSTRPLFEPHYHNACETSIVLDRDAEQLNIVAERHDWEIQRFTLVTYGQPDETGQCPELARISLSISETEQLRALLNWLHAQG